MLNLATLSYVGEALKFTAVPAGLFELFLPAKERRGLENTLDRSTQYLFILSFVLIAIVYFVILIVPVLTPYLPYIMIGLYIGNELLKFVNLLSGFRLYESTGLMTILILIGLFSVPVFALAPIFRYVPHGYFAFAAAFLPADVLPEWFRGNIPWVGYVLPHYSTTLLIETYDREISWLTSTQDTWWVWWIVGWMFWPASWLSDGFMLIGLVALHLSFPLFVVLAPVFLISFLARSFFKLSDILRDKFGLQQEDRIPLAAGVLYAIGETLLFGINTYKYFLP